MFNLKRVSPLVLSGQCCMSSTSHYDVLGVTPSSTQNEIKSAYYKLSKQYHPDISKDDAEGKKFRSIKEAYEVLGNVKMKKLYDKGVLSRGQTPLHRQRRHEPDDPALRFYKHHINKDKVPTMDGRRPIYDFDAWSRHHYGTTLERNKLAKEKIKRQETNKKLSEKTAQDEALMYSIAAIVGIFFYCCIHGVDDLDRVSSDKK